MKEKNVYDTICKIPFLELLKFSSEKLIALERQTTSELYTLSLLKKEKSRDYRRACLALKWIQGARRIKAVHEEKTAAHNDKEVIFVGRIIKGDIDG